MTKISINLANLQAYNKAISTYYSDKDLVLENTTECEVYTLRNLTNSGKTITLSKIDDGKVPANTAIVINGVYGTKTADFIVQDKNTFPKIESIGFGVTEKKHVDTIRHNCLALTVDSKTGMPVFLEWDLSYNDYLPANKALVPFSIYFKKDISYINDYYYDVTGLHFDVVSLYNEYKDKPSADRQKILDKLLWHITGIASCDNYFKHPRHEGKNQSANQTSYLKQMLYNLFMQNI